MLEQTKRISFRISSFLNKVEPDLQTGSDQKVPAPARQCSCQVKPLHRNGLIAGVFNMQSVIILKFAP